MVTSLLNSVPHHTGLGVYLNRPASPFRIVDRKSTRLNSSHSQISYAVFCLKKKKEHRPLPGQRRTHGRRILIPTRPFAFELGLPLVTLVPCPLSARVPPLAVLVVDGLAGPR